MTTLNNMEEAWDYVRRLGFLPKPSPGWIPVTQSRMCNLSNLLEYMGGAYPFDVHTRLYTENGLRWPWYSTFEVRGKNGALSCDLSAWRNERDPKSAQIVYYTVSTPEDDDDEGYTRRLNRYGFKQVFEYPVISDVQFFENAAQKFIHYYLRRFQKCNPTWHIQIWDSGLGGSIEHPTFALPTLTVQIEIHDWSG